MSGRGFKGTVRGGAAGERAIATAYGGRVMGRGREVECAQCRAADLVLVPPFPPFVPDVLLQHPQLHVEVKTDTYNPERTPNMFLEHNTARPNGTLIRGGPWRAAGDGIELFAYYYPKGGLVVWLWDLPALAGTLDALLGSTQTKLRPRFVSNPDGYDAIGYIVRRDTLQELHPDGYYEDRL